MPTFRTAPSYTAGSQVHASYLASVDDSAWVVVANAHPDADHTDTGYTVLLVRQRAANETVHPGPLDLDLAHSIARLRAESERDKARGLPSPCAA